MKRKSRLSGIIIMTIILIFTLNGWSTVTVYEKDVSSKLVSSIPLKSSQILSVSFIDVGQGDAIFVELPNNQTMLIDAGNPENGPQVVRYVQDRGYNKIDYLIITHPHIDHIGGIKEVVKELNIGAIYMPYVSNNTRQFKEMLVSIKDKGLKINTAEAGVHIVAGKEINIHILSPAQELYENLNNYSAVIKLTYKSTTFLFMGDAEEEIEEKIAANVDSDVLKVGHHGSITSSKMSFIKKVKPIYSVISVDKNNDYGHPAQETFNNLLAVRSKVYRTDQDGTIIISSDGANITVRKVRRRSYYRAA